MVLEVATEPNINIRDLVIPETPMAEAGPFNPADELREEDWKKFEEALEHGRKRNFGVSYLEVLSNLRMLNPERYKTVPNDKEVVDGAIENGKTLVTQFLNHPNGREFTKTWRQLFLGAPDRFGEVEIDESIRRHAIQTITQVDLHSALLIASDLRIIFPSIEAGTGIDADVWDANNDMIAIFYENNRIDHVVKNAADMRIVAHGSNWKLNIPESWWVKIREEFEEQKIELRENSGWSSDGEFLTTGGILSTFASIAILAADELEITDEGLKLVFNEKQKEPAPEQPLPEVKEL